MEFAASLWDLAVHLDVHLAAFVARHGAWVYGLLFAIVFCETGLVVTPFLPGDSLLFVTGTLAAAGGMDIAVVMATLVCAALWVGSICLAGYFFGNIPAVKGNLTLVIIGIVALSISPGVIAWLRSRSVQRQG